MLLFALLCVVICFTAHESLGDGIQYFLIIIVFILAYCFYLSRAVLNLKTAYHKVQRKYGLPLFFKLPNQIPTQATATCISQIVVPDQFGLNHCLNFKPPLNSTV